MATITTKTTSTFSWADFNASELKVGDEITDVLKDGREVTFVIMDNRVCGLKNCLGEYVMNNTWTNKSGWLASEMRRYLNEDIFPLLPDDLRNIIHPRNFGKESDMLWLFSEAEIFGEQDWTEKELDRGEQFEYFKDPANRGEQFEYFKDPANRIKCDEDGEPTWWWERSPYATYATDFCIVGSDGSASSNYANTSRGVCFGFYF